MIPVRKFDAVIVGAGGAGAMLDMLSRLIYRGEKNTATAQPAKLDATVAAMEALGARRARIAAAIGPCIGCHFMCVDCLHCFETKRHPECLFVAHCFGGGYCRMGASSRGRALAF